MEELVPLAGIYIDRLVYAADVQLTASNWKCICAVAILLATKVRSCRVLFNCKTFKGMCKLRSGKIYTLGMLTMLTSSGELRKSRPASQGFWRDTK
eukprot:4989451-Amphidinium_carterae.1